MTTRRHLKLALIAAAVTMLVGRRSHAYGGGVHHGIAAYSWQVMRAAADPQFGSHVAWKVAPPSPLSQAGTCDLCGTGATQAAWNTFITKIPNAMGRLNGLDAGVGFIPCSDKISSDNTLKGMLVGMSTSPGALEGSAPCFSDDPKANKTLGSRLQGGAYDGRWHPGGIFDYVTPNSALDGNGYQGLLLGWEAKSGDDHVKDTVFESAWLMFGTVGAVIIVAVAAVLLIATGLLGPLIAVVCALAILFCLAGIFDGDGCGNGVINGFTGLIEAAHAPITALDNNVPELDGIIPRGGDISSGQYTGMWHFINAKPGGSNSYDDREGLYYDDAGPSFAPGQFDTIIQAGLDLGDLHIGYDESDGPHHYEIRSGNDGHADSDHRSWAKWQGPSGAHLQFSPLDNFGFYGWSNFLTTKSAYYLSWPLHALGDATVPMHVTGTTSWGHRPYEDALEWGEKWNVVRFLNCTPELNGACAQTCFVDFNNPASTCPEHIDAVDNSRQQFEQARRILQHAFRWTQFIANWRTANNRPTDVPVRDLVTQVALDTYDLTFNGGADNVWPWCDDCSMDWLLYNNHNHGMDFYETDASLASERDLIERSVGASLAFLVAASDTLPAPAACSNTSCGTGTVCCGNRSCTGGLCCVATQGACEHDTDCCFTNGLPSLCRNRVCQPGAVAACQQPGEACSGSSAACCADSGGAQQCGLSRNGASICCSGDNTQCTASVQCCSGSCSSVNGEIGHCKRLPLRSGCTSTDQCDSTSVCQSDGAPVGAGKQGTCCNPDATGALGCNGDEDCCTGHCKPVGADDFTCQCAVLSETCARDNDCCQGTCKNGTCQLVLNICQPPLAACQQGTDCCSGGCTSTHVCTCIGTGPSSTCGSDIACCTNNCANGVCGSCKSPLVDCFGRCCPGGTTCCGFDATSQQPICQAGGCGIVNPPK